MSTELLEAPVTADPAEGSAPLVTRLVTQHGAVWATAATLDTVLARPGDQVLFFHGDPVRFPEVLDVAVVLPELQAAHAARPFRIGVVRREDEDAIARRYGSQRWPALVFLRDGGYVATVPGMHDWSDFVARVGAALDSPTSRAPGIGIPLVSAGATSGCH